MPGCSTRILEIKSEERRLGTTNAAVSALVPVPLPNLLGNLTRDHKTCTPVIDWKWLLNFNRTVCSLNRDGASSRHLLIEVSFPLRHSISFHDCH
jgi:hypothetical protein